MNKKELFKPQFQIFRISFQNTQETRKNYRLQNDEKQ